MININKIPKDFRSLVPYFLKRFLVRMYIRWNMRHSPGSQDEPRISFASILPLQGSFIRGGKVKLTYLRKKFGEYNTGYNILYLVSSALPGFADIWAEEAERKGVKIVWNQNGVGYPAWTTEWQKINNSMKPITKADYVIYQSEFCRRDADRYVSPFVGPYTILNNCIDTDKKKPAVLPLPLSPIRLLVTGTHMTREKVIVPLEAMRLLLDRGYNTLLEVYGPSEWPNAEAEIAEKITDLNLKDKVAIHGKYLQDESGEIYQRGHILIHVKYMDPSPTTPLSAMAAGLPVIGSGSGGMVELVSPEAGILIDVPDSRDKLYYPRAEEVAEAVERIMKEWPTWSRMAREHAVKNFSVEKWVDIHERIFNKLLQNSGRSTDNIGDNAGIQRREIPSRGY